MVLASCLDEGRGPDHQAGRRLANRADSTITRNSVNGKVGDALGRRGARAGKRRDEDAGTWCSGGAVAGTRGGEREIGWMRHCFNNAIAQPGKAEYKKSLAPKGARTGG